MCISVCKSRRVSAYVVPPGHPQARCGLHRAEDFVTVCYSEVLPKGTSVTDSNYDLGSTWDCKLLNTKEFLKLARGLHIERKQTEDLTNGKHQKQ